MLAKIDTYSIPGLRVECAQRNSGPVMMKHHFHPFYEIYYLLEGSRSYFVDGKVYRVQEGGMVFVGANQIHKTTGDGASPHKRILLEIDRSMVEMICKRMPEVSMLSLLGATALAAQLQGEERKQTECIFESMLGELRTQRPGFEEFVRIRLEEVLLGMLRRRSPWSLPVAPDENETYAKVYEIVEYISTHYAELHALQELCERFYISKYYLCHIFKNVTGFTIQEYITVTRIRNAQSLLLCSVSPITQIAQYVGYDNVTHFDRMFKKHAGISPSQYRKRYSM